MNFKLDQNLVKYPNDKNNNIDITEKTKKINGSLNTTENANKIIESLNSTVNTKNPEFEYDNKEKVEKIERERKSAIEREKIALILKRKKEESEYLKKITSIQLAFKKFISIKLRNELSDKKVILRFKFYFDIFF